MYVFFALRYCGQPIRKPYKHCVCPHMVYICMYVYKYFTLTPFAPLTPATPRSPFSPLGPWAPGLPGEPAGPSAPYKYKMKVFTNMYI